MLAYVEPVIYIMSLRKPIFACMKVKRRMILEYIRGIMLGTMTEKDIDTTVDSTIGRPCVCIRFLFTTFVGERLGRGYSLGGSPVAEF